MKGKNRNAKKVSAKAGRKMPKEKLYTVMPFHHDEKVEKYKLDLGNDEACEFAGDTTYRCDGCFADLKKWESHRTYMLYAEDIDHDKKQIRVLDGVVLRKFCSNCLQFLPDIDTDVSKCMFCKAKSGRNKQLLEVVREDRVVDKKRGAELEVDVIGNATLGRICMNCAKKLSGKKNSLLKIYGFIKLTKDWKKSSN